MGQGRGRSTRRGVKGGARGRPGGRSRGLGHPGHGKRMSRRLVQRIRMKPPRKPYVPPRPPAPAAPRVDLQEDTYYKELYFRIRDALPAIQAEFMADLVRLGVLPAERVSARNLEELAERIEELDYTRTQFSGVSRNTAAAEMVANMNATEEEREEAAAEYQAMRDTLQLQRMVEMPFAIQLVIQRPENEGGDPDSHRIYNYILKYTSISSFLSYDMKLEAMEGDRAEVLPYPDHITGIAFGTKPAVGVAFQEAVNTVIEGRIMGIEQQLYADVLAGRVVARAEELPRNNDFLSRGRWGNGGAGGGAGGGGGGRTGTLSYRSYNNSTDADGKEFEEMNSNNGSMAGSAAGGGAGGGGAGAYRTPVRGSGNARLQRLLAERDELRAESLRLRAAGGGGGGAASVPNTPRTVASLGFGPNSYQRQLGRASASLQRMAAAGPAGFSTPSVRRLPAANEPPPAPGRGAGAGGLGAVAENATGESESGSSFGVGNSNSEAMNQERRRGQPPHGHGPNGGAGGGATGLAGGRRNSRRRV